MTSRRLLMFAAWLVWSPAVALAQSDRFELGAQLISVNLSPVDQADFGLGARFSWNPVQLAGLESEINLSERSAQRGSIQPRADRRIVRRDGRTQIRLAEAICKSKGRLPEFPCRDGAICLRVDLPTSAFVPARRSNPLGL